MLKRIFKNIYAASFVASFISCITLTQASGAKYALHVNELVAQGVISNYLVNILITVVIIGIGFALILYASRKSVTPANLIKFIVKMYTVFAAIMVVVIYDGRILTIDNNITYTIRIVTYLIFESLLFVLPLLVWGVINNIYSNDKKKVTYVVLSLVIALITILTPLLITTYFKSILFNTDVKPAIIAFAGLVVLYVFISNWLQHAPKNSDADQKHISASRFPWLKSSLLLIVVTTGGVFSLFNSVFLYYVYSQHPELLRESFNDTNYLAIILTSSTIIAIVLYGFADYALRKRTWRFALQGAIAGLFLSCVIAFTIVFLMPTWYFFTTVTIHNFFGSVRAILIFPLIQMLYLYLPVNDRFNMKLKVEMVCVPAAILLISTAVTYFASAININNALTYTSLSVGIVLMLAALWVSRRIGADLKH